jgi:hypothetical protein
VIVDHAVGQRMDESVEALAIEPQPRHHALELRHQARPTCSPLNRPSSTGSVAPSVARGSPQPGLAASLRRLVAHPTVQKHAQRRDEGERLVQHDVVPRLGHLDDGRSRSH